MLNCSSNCSTYNIDSFRPLLVFFPDVIWIEILFCGSNAARLYLLLKLAVKRQTHRTEMNDVVQLRLEH